MKRAFFLGLISAYTAFGQVYAVTVNQAGANYSTAPTVTPSGGGCTTQPTFVASVSNGGLNSVAPTFMGTGCTSAPSLAIGGPGTGASAAAVLLPASITVMAAVPSTGGNGIQPAIGGTYTAWQFACWLTVPAARVPFYANNVFRMPGTSQVSQVIPGPAGFGTALATGIVTEFVDVVNVTSSVAVGVVQAAVVSSCSAQQSSLNAWNPWAKYGSSYLNGVWTGVTIQ